MNSKANTVASARKAWYKMPKGWTWEWFLVVNAGNGQIALHSKVHNRFLRMNSRGGVDASSASFANRLPRKWAWERFTVVNAGNREIALHNKAHNRFVRMGSKRSVVASPVLSAKFLPKSSTSERFRIVQRGRCKRKRKIPKKKKKIPRRKRRKIKRCPCCPRGCLADDHAKRALRHYLNVGKGDFTLRLSFKLKKRQYTSAAVVLAGGNRVGLDPLFTGRTAPGRGSWAAVRQYGRGPQPMKWHCLVLRRKMGRVSGFLNGKYIFSRPLKQYITHIDIEPARNIMWAKDFDFQRGWEASVKCSKSCGVKIGGKSLLQVSAPDAPELAGSHLASSHEPLLRWTTDLVSTTYADGRERHRIVELMGTSKEGFLLNQLAEVGVAMATGIDASAQGHPGKIANSTAPAGKDGSANLHHDANQTLVFLRQVSRASAASEATRRLRLNRQHRDLLA